MCAGHCRSSSAADKPVEVLSVVIMSKKGTLFGHKMGSLRRTESGKETFHTAGNQR